MHKAFTTEQLCYTPLCVDSQREQDGGKRARTLPNTNGRIPVGAMPAL